MWPRSSALSRFESYFIYLESWRLSDLSKRLEVSEVSVRKGLETWIDHGIVCETEPNVFITVEEAGSGSGDAGRPVARNGKTVVIYPSSSLSIFFSVVTVIEEQAPAVSSAQQEEAEQMRVYWKFIEGMLTNLGQLPLDRIQTMLKFAPNYSKTMDQLSVFMEAARREGLVTVSGGLWKLNR